MNKDDFRFAILLLSPGVLGMVPGGRANLGLGSETGLSMVLRLSSYFERALGLVTVLTLAFGRVCCSADVMLGRRWPDDPPVKVLLIVGVTGVVVSFGVGTLTWRVLLPAASSLNARTNSVRLRQMLSALRRN